MYKYDINNNKWELEGIPEEDQQKIKNIVLYHLPLGHYNLDGFIGKDKYYMVSMWNYHSHVNIVIHNDMDERYNHHYSLIKQFVDELDDEYVILPVNVYNNMVFNMNPDFQNELETDFLMLLSEKGYSLEYKGDNYLISKPCAHREVEKEVEIRYHIIKTFDGEETRTRVKNISENSSYYCAKCSMQWDTEADWRNDRS